MKLDFIIDFETIGQNVLTIPMIDCSYLIFNWDRFTSKEPYTFEELVRRAQKAKFDLKELVTQHGMKYKSSDLNWWKEQAPDVKVKLNPSAKDVSVNQFIDDMLEYIGNNKISNWWSRSNTFDPILLQRLGQAVDRLHEIDEKLKFWAIRDTRTWIDAKFDFAQKNGFIPISDVEYWNSAFKQHDSSHDIAADVLRLQTICRAENEMEQTER